MIIVVIGSALVFLGDRIGIILLKCASIVAAVLLTRHLYTKWIAIATQKNFSANASCRRKKVWPNGRASVTYVIKRTFGFLTYDMKRTTTKTGLGSAPLKKV